MLGLMGVAISIVRECNGQVEKGLCWELLEVR
jgi:hypothetical protein